MARLVVDAMGGDNGSKIVVEAIKNFKAKNPDAEFIVVGRKEELSELEGMCRIIDAPDIVPMTAGALEVMRMRNSSMMVAIRTLKEEKFDAVVSCGSTGGFLSASTIVLKMIPGVKRAALTTAFPTYRVDKKMTVLDIGASNENSPEELVQFALMGRLYHQAVFGVENPTVYLLSNGAEEGKGSPEAKEAYKLLKEANFPNFCGNIEGRDCFSGDVDVVVTDGYTGNVFIKTCEGVAKLFKELLGDVFTKNLWHKIGYLHVKPGMKHMSKIMDYKSVGGAILLGVNGIAFKAHGNSDAYAFECALDVVSKLCNVGIVKAIEEGVNNG